MSFVKMYKLKCLETKLLCHYNILNQQFNEFSQTTCLLRRRHNPGYHNSKYKSRAPNPFIYQYDYKGRVLQLDRKDNMMMGKKKIPFRPHEPISIFDVSGKKWGGSHELVDEIKKNRSRFPHQPGYYDKKTGKFVLVKEMIPEFVVPDLKDFYLKPYVPYCYGEDIRQEEFTAKALFKATYGKKLVEDYNNGAVKDLDAVVEALSTEADEKETMQS